MSEGRATARYVRTSAQKAKLVMDLIRGQSVDRALSTLRFARKRIAHDIEKVLRSAVANAQQKEGGAEVDRMFVSSCYADQGPSMKRIRPAPMGRAFRIVKRTAHLTVHVSERPRVVRPAAATPATMDAGAPETVARRSRKTATKKTARTTSSRASAKTAKKTATKKTAKKAPAKTTTAGKAPAKKQAAWKATAKKATAGKATAKKTTAKTTKKESGGSKSTD